MACQQPGPWRLRQQPTCLKRSNLACGGCDSSRLPPAKLGLGLGAWLAPKPKVQVAELRTHLRGDRKYRVKRETNTSEQELLWLWLREVERVHQSHGVES